MPGDENLLGALLRTDGGNRGERLPDVLHPGVKTLHRTGQPLRSPQLLQAFVQTGE
jgi:hypothetical protein